jgi:hypothetical protein
MCYLSISKISSARFVDGVVRIHLSVSSSRTRVYGTQESLKRCDGLGDGSLDEKLINECVDKFNEIEQIEQSACCCRLQLDQYMEYAHSEDKRQQTSWTSLAHLARSFIVLLKDL